SGDIDTYVEYTGTGLELLGDTRSDVEAAFGASPAASPESGQTGMDAVYDYVKEQYEEQFNLTWLKPWGFQNTYALAMTRDRVEELGAKTISDLKPYAGDLVLGAQQEFLVREDDGLEGLEETYDIHFKDAHGMDPGLVYDAL